MSNAPGAHASAPAAGEGRVTGLSHPKTTDKVVQLVLDEDLSGKRVLDLGAGRGVFCKKFIDAAAPLGIDAPAVLSACDLYARDIVTKSIPRVAVDFSHQLPYRDAAFDIVVCVEVIEHVPNQVAFMAEIFRILKPGGRAIVSTPNILNANGRIRFLATGTWPLFDIMPHSTRSVVSVSGGHIGPISLYYLYYFAKIAGFATCNWHIDRVKRSASYAAPFIWLAYQLLRPIYSLRQRRRPWYDENRDAIAELNRWQTLVGRTIILEARKPAAAPPTT